MESVKIARELATILNEKNLTKINFKNKDVMICVESAPPVTQTIVPTVAAATAGVPTAVQSTEKPKLGKYVTSPIVGTFYTSPAPDKPPFVKVGDKVSKGQVVCIVESMKLMNEINCEFDGTVAAVLAMDGDAVDFGKELIEIV
ncbi:MAG: acetyl-CoA carboxylase biotin carboxyl carrier protein [Oscillospiraceae bacterium]|nr:acetyl-CoA carboxylase biotin carboxyl carrier protein [Oscillospiraceae bacterium]